MDMAQTEPTIWIETQEILKGLFPYGEGLGKGDSLRFPLISTAFFEWNTTLVAGRGSRTASIPGSSKISSSFSVWTQRGVLQGAPVASPLPDLLHRGNGDQEEADGLGGILPPNRSFLPDSLGIFWRDLRG